MKEALQASLSTLYILCTLRGLPLLASALSTPSALSTAVTPSA